MKLSAAVLTALVAVGVAAPAGAAPWQRVTTTDGSSIDQVGLARTGDGVLHLAWHHPTGPNTEDLLHTVIARDGTLGATNPIQTGWTGFSNPRSWSIPAACGCSGAASARPTPTTRRGRSTRRSR